MKAIDYIDDKISNNPKEWKGLRNMSVEDIAQLMEDYAKAINKNSVIRDVIDSLPCVMSPECEIIMICADKDVANKEMEEFKKQHSGEWYVDDVRIQK